MSGNNNNEVVPVNEESVNFTEPCVKMSGNNLTMPNDETASSTTPPTSAIMNGEVELKFLEKTKLCVLAEGCINMLLLMSHLIIQVLIVYESFKHMFESIGINIALLLMQTLLVAIYLMPERYFHLIDDYHYAKNM